MDAVGAVDVGVARRAEHRRVARGPSPEAVCSRVLVVVGLDLHDLASNPVDEHRHADELGSNIVNRSREEIPLQLHSRCGSRAS